jgi:hypothetical protein
MTQALHAHMNNKKKDKNCIFGGIGEGLGPQTHAAMLRLLGLTNFLPRLTLNCSSPDTGMSHLVSLITSILKMRKLRLDRTK